jgi:hypothetical protein
VLLALYASDPALIPGARAAVSEQIEKGIVSGAFWR